MARLTEDQISFIKRIGVPIEKTFDATGLARMEFKKIMKEESLEIAYGVTPCAKGNHTLRTRSGHCVQCNPAYLRFQNRHSETGILYLAVSKIGGVVKFGVTQDVEGRKASLNSTGYGGFDDWKIILHSKIYEAGKVEQIIHNNISRLRLIVEYPKDGKMQIAYEVFKMPITKAKDIFNKYINQ